MRRNPGSTVYAGTLNVGSTLLHVKTTTAAGDTAVARMAALVEQARCRPTTMLRCVHCPEPAPLCEQPPVPLTQARPPCLPAGCMAALEVEHFLEAHGQA